MEIKATLLEHEYTEWARRINVNLNGKEYKVSLLWSEWDGYIIRSIDDQNIHDYLDEAGLNWAELAEELDDLTYKQVNNG